MTAHDQNSDATRRVISPRVILLAGPGDATDIVANWLDEHIGKVTLVTEEGQSRVRLTRRRFKRLGGLKTLGQVAFMVLAIPVLQRQGRQRKRQILTERNLNVTPRSPDFRVQSVNAPETVELLARLEPALVVVNGTRIIASRVLDSINCPTINTHAGITPRYRGVHGGYWALAEGHPEDVGTTVHMVDSGIDTGGVLGWAYFDTSPADTIATYPYLHLAAGLPLLRDLVRTALNGQPLTPIESSSQALDSRLFTHPTLWGYLRLWATRGVR